MHAQAHSNNKSETRVLLSRTKDAARLKHIKSHNPRAPHCWLNTVLPLACISLQHSLNYKRIYSPVNIIWVLYALCETTRPAETWWNLSLHSYIGISAAIDWPPGIENTSSLIVCCTCVKYYFLPKCDKLSAAAISLELNSIWIRARGINKSWFSSAATNCSSIRILAKAESIIIETFNRSNQGNKVSRTCNYSMIYIKRFLEIFLGDGGQFGAGGCRLCVTGVVRE